MDISSSRATPTYSTLPTLDCETACDLILKARRLGLHALEKLWNEPGFAKTALRLDGSFLFFGSDKIRNDERLVELAMESVPSAYLDASLRVQRIRRIAEIAFRLNRSNFEQAHPEIRDDEDLLKIALISFPTAYYSASPRLQFRYEFDKINTEIKTLGSPTKADELEELFLVQMKLRSLIQRWPIILESAIHVAENRPDLIPLLPAEFRDRLDVIVRKKNLTGTRIKDRFDWIATCKRVEIAAPWPTDDRQMPRRHALRNRSKF